MNLYKTLFLSISLSVSPLSCLIGWTELEDAKSDGAKMKMTLAVVDNEGHAVSNVWIHGGMYCDTGASWGTGFGGYTDAEGRFRIAGRTTGRVIYSATKDDFYTTVSEFDFSSGASGIKPAVRNGKWQPYGLELNIRLKRIVNPKIKHWFYGKLLNPPRGRWVGVDLEVLDLCSPYGGGVHQDVLLRYIDSAPETGWRSRHGSMELAFTNNHCAGAYLIKKDQWSDFKSCYIADTNNDYSLRYFRFEQAREPQKILKSEEFPNDSYIVFRTRTKVDNNGGLVSAHYGKIYGPWGYSDSVRFESVLFNDTPNDPNLEEEETSVQARLHVKGMRERGEMK